MRVLCLLLLVIALNLYAQTSEIEGRMIQDIEGPPVRPRAPYRPESRTLRRTSNEIRARRPETSVVLIERDKKVISTSLAKISEVFTERGFSAAEAEAAATSSWLEMRAGANSLPLTAPLDDERFTNFVLSLGKLIVNSNPSDADVEIDGIKLQDKTNFAKWIRPGKHRLRLSKAEHEPLEEEFEIKEGKKTQIEKNLPQKNQ